VARWMRRPDGLAAWLLLLTAVFNFAPALFTNESLSEAALSTRLIKDGPVLALIAVLLVHVGRSGWSRAAREIKQSASIRLPGRVLRGSATPAEGRAGLFLSICAMGAFMAASVLVVAPPSLGVLASVRYYVLYPALALLLAFSMPTRLRPLAVGVVVLGCLQTVVALLDFMGAWGNTYYAGAVQLVGYVFPRAIGTLGNPNNLGIFLAFALILVVSTGCWRTRWGRVASAVLAVGLVLTFSKAVVLALALTYSGALWTWSRHRPTRDAVLVGVGVLGLVAIFTSTRVTAADGLLGLFGHRGGTTYDGLYTWLEGPFAFLVGHGFAAQASVDATGALQETVTDNMALGLAVEGGLVGLLLFALMVSFGLRLILQHPVSQRLGTVSRRYAVLFLIYTPLAPNFRLFPGALLFWVLVGLCASATRKAAESVPVVQLSEGDTAVRRHPQAAPVEQESTFP
jgi:hypothetical protein